MNKVFQRIDTTLFVFKYPEIQGIKVLLIILFATSSFFAIYISSIFAFLLSLVALYFIFTHDSILLDLENKRYKRTRLLGALVIGRSWEDLPEISYISVFKTIMVSTSHSITYRTIELKEKVVMINLVYDKNCRLNVYQSFDVDEAMNKAQLISEKLDLRIYDATTKVGKWIEN